MTRPSAPLRWASACLAVLLLAPATTLAESSGGGVAAPGGYPPVVPSLLGGTAPAPAPAPAPTPAPSGPNTLQPPPGGARLGSVTLVRGMLTPGATGRSVLLELRDPRRGWTIVATGKAGAGGSFAVAWRPQRVGRFLLRAQAAGRGATVTVQPAAQIEVYRSVVATWFGPGSYGSRTACGQLMTAQLIGVAHRTLPCGTMVDIAFGSQTISVPVVDRGPYANGASLDLTSATAQTLGVDGTARVGAAVAHGTAASDL